MRAGIFSFILLVFFSSTFSCFTYYFSEEQENELNRNARARLKDGLESKFEPLLECFRDKNVSYSTELYYLLDDINSDFIDDNIINQDLYDRICEFLHQTLSNNPDLNDKVANEKLLKRLVETCTKCFEKDTQARNRMMKSIKIEQNEKRFKTLADICHLFREPVQWLILSSSSYGHPEMFKDIPVLLENIRKLFWETEASNLDVILEEKLNILKNSFDYNLWKYSAPSTEASQIQKMLKEDFMEIFKNICQKLMKLSYPFETLSTGLGEQAIKINVIDIQEFETTNEKLWDYICFRIEAIRSELNVNEVMVIDFIISKIQKNSTLNSPFSLKDAIKLIKSGLKEFISLSYPSEDRLMEIIDEELGVDSQNLRSVFNESIEKFSEELEVKIREIKETYQINSEESVNLDFSIIAVSMMAKTNNIES